MRAAKVEAARAAREAEQESRDAAFKEQLRKKKAEERAAKLIESKNPLLSAEE